MDCSDNGCIILYSFVWIKHACFLIVPVAIQLQLLGNFLFQQCQADCIHNSIDRLSVCSLVGQNAIILILNRGQIESTLCCANVRNIRCNFGFTLLGLNWRFGKSSQRCTHCLICSHYPGQRISEFLELFSKSSSRSLSFWAASTFMSRRKAHLFPPVLYPGSASTSGLHSQFRTLQWTTT